MKRPALFVALTVVFFVWTFPHQLVVERLVRTASAAIGVSASIEEVTLLWPKIARLSVSPPGYLVRGIRLSRNAHALNIPTLYLGFGFRGGVNFESDACGGSWRGKLQRGRRLELTFTGVDPEACLDLDGLRVQGRFGGAVALRGVGRGQATGPLGPFAREGRLSLEARGAKVAGPALAQALGSGAAMATVNVEAVIDRTSIVLDGSSAAAEGLDWRLPRARLQGRGTAMVLAGRLEVRRRSEETRAKMIAGLLPETTRDSQGWRGYALSGSLARPKLAPFR